MSSFPETLIGLALLGEGICMSVLQGRIQDFF